ncbi:nuclear receptor subfamily 1 group D member 2-like [Mercenaria mercenaria]|uniref:nuclear receptor subfamily 1 group D member 2-like n=1 Tax=Mercenaria mercenaria TaxID=6596 RepID=UPI00234E861D|nr:nuclear receptor subfamily 1 group D member 2-like [Mercenaria mercenaria]
MQGLFQGFCNTVFKAEPYMSFCDNDDDGNNVLIRGQINGDERISEVTVSPIQFQNNNEEYIPPGTNVRCNTWNGNSSEESLDAAKKRHKQDSRHRKPFLPPCVVCGETSTGFHYGANTCEACKGFFRRNLMKDEVEYKCKCTPEMQEAWKRGPRKNGCQACRYKRCLAVGMSRNAIKLGRYTYNHKTRNTKQAKYIESLNNNKEEIPTFSENSPSSSSSSSTHSSSAHVQYDTFSPENFGISLTAHVTDNSIGPYDYCDSPMKTTNRKAATKTHILAMGISQQEIDTDVRIVTEAHLASVNPVGTPIEIIKKKQDEYLESYKSRQQNGDHPDTDCQMHQAANLLTLFEEKVIKAVSFAKKIPGFRDLRLDDQASLIKASRIELTLFCAYRYLLTHLDFDRQVVTSPWGEELHLDELSQLIPINITMKRYQYAQRLEDLKLTIQELSVLRAIITLASDRCQLIEPDKVDALQQKYVTCLQHLLNIRPRGPGTLLYKIFNFITNVRELTEVEGELSKKLLSEWPTVSKDNFYLLKELST